MNREQQIKTIIYYSDFKLKKTLDLHGLYKQIQRFKG